MGPCRGSRDGSALRVGGRQAEGAFAGGAANRRHGDLQGGRERLRNPARRQPSQARHQDHWPQAEGQQSRRCACPRNDRRSSASATTDERRAMSWFSPKSKPSASCDAPASGDAIVVDHITKKYGDFTAVDDVSFNVHQGEIFGLLGPNGAGKSTLIRMMTTLLPATSGRAVINGFDVAKEPDSARHCMGVIPQALTSDIDLTVEENLSIYAKLYGVPAADRKRNIDDLLQTVDLTKWRHPVPGSQFPAPRRPPSSRLEFGPAAGPLRRDRLGGLSVRQGHCQPPQTPP